MAPASWRLLLAGACAAAASASEIAGGSAAADTALRFTDEEEMDGECTGEGEAECSLSLRQLRARQLDVASEDRGEGARDAESVEKVVLSDNQSESEEKNVDVAEAAAMNPHHPHYHARSAPQSQLRWAHDRQFCMSDDGGPVHNGRPLVLWTCGAGKAGLSQFFNYNPSHDATLLRSAQYIGMCVTIDGDQATNGAKVHLWQCNPSDKAQHWIVESDGYQNALLRSSAFPGKCLVVNLNMAWDGNKLQMWDCYGNKPYKQWTLTHQ